MLFFQETLIKCSKLGNHPAEHGRELHAKPKFLDTIKAYLATTFGPNSSDFFDLCLHWVSVVRGIWIIFIEESVGKTIEF